jgi:hypothetical protein
MIKKGELYASHLAHSWGTRDGVFLVTLLEMMKDDPDSLPKNVRERDRVVVVVFEMF